MELLQEFVFIPLDIYRETRHNKGIPIRASRNTCRGGELRPILYGIMDLRILYHIERVGSKI